MPVQIVYTNSPLNPAATPAPAQFMEPPPPITVAAGAHGVEASGEALLSQLAGLAVTLQGISGSLKTIASNLTQLPTELAQVNATLVQLVAKNGSTSVAGPKAAGLSVTGWQPSLNPSAANLGPDPVLELNPIHRATARKWIRCLRALFLADPGGWVTTPTWTGVANSLGQAPAGPQFYKVRSFLLTYEYVTEYEPALPLEVKIAPAKRRIMEGWRLHAVHPLETPTG